ncbi:DUF4129 domain-containing protein [Glaciihabitans arcticus]|uniref:DUF4129 domain-containing protein n=1 Tax=Glaciihabitans arcticus TaxID=2668039 RepID=A0A4Q9GSC1_9MICO|nr:DUF4129 domain-containing protein [Glaciihabitans arcticus]TBN55997.1 DUF4129 domain-containing protein [Glaciihabitans arcticus]
MRPHQTVLASVPVDPDRPEAQQWLLDELAKPEYQAARPTWFDLAARAVMDWITSLEVFGVSGPPGLVLLVVLGIAVIGLVLAFLIFGVPRLGRRSRVTGSLFGSDDDRDAAAIRRSAESAARSGDYSLAIAEMFRSIARGLAERTVLTTSPGTTAHEFATQAGRAFPAEATALSAASAAFDGVRYLGQDGTAEQYSAVSALEIQLRSVRPQFDTVDA